MMAEEGVITPIDLGAIFPTKAVGLSGCFRVLRAFSCARAHRRALASNLGVIFYLDPPRPSRGFLDVPHR